VIREGDQVQLSVWGYPEFNTSTFVRETGTITVPLVGEVPAAGLTKEQLTELVIQKLSDYVKSKVYLTISIVETMTQKVIVWGAIARQDLITVSSAVPLLQVLAGAGGPAAGADLSQVRIYRNGDLSRPIEVDLSGYVTYAADQYSGPDQFPLVYPGDMVYVPREENFVREFSGYLTQVVLLFGIFAVVQ
jgi:polysaccharide export outer membrane protein